MVVGRAACWQPPCMEFVFCPLQLQQSVIVGIAVKSTSWYFHRKWREVSKMVFTDKYDHEVNIRRSRVTRRTSRFGGGIVLHWNFVFFLYLQWGSYCHPIVGGWQAGSKVGIVSLWNVSVRVTCGPYGICKRHRCNEFQKCSVSTLYSLTLALT